MKLKRISAIVLVASMVLTAGACSSDSKEKDSSKEKKMTEESMKTNDKTGATGLLRSAAQHMPSTANALAVAISTQSPDKFPGDPESGASELRSGLTSLLQEHVYLTGFVVRAATLGQESKTQVATLDENSVALGAAVESVYGEKAGEQFLALWRKHIGFFVDYTVGKASGDDAKSSEALTNLEGYGSDFGAFIDSATKGGLDKATVEGNLGEHVKTLTTAIDAFAAKDTTATEKLQMAAMHMTKTADALSGAFVAQFPEKFKGDIQSGSSSLRATLTYGLQEHVYLAGLTTVTALGGDNYDAQAAALDGNSVALSKAIASVYGEPAGEQFLALWRKHIGFFVDFTVGTATSDDVKTKQALADLQGYGSDFGAFIDSATDGNLPKEAVVENLTMHVKTLTAAITAQAKEAK